MARRQRVVAGRRGVPDELVVPHLVAAEARVEALVSRRRFEISEIEQVRRRAVPRLQRALCDQDRERVGGDVVADDLADRAS